MFFSPPGHEQYLGQHFFECDECYKGYCYITTSYNLDKHEIHYVKTIVKVCKLLSAVENVYVYTFIYVDVYIFNNYSINQHVLFTFPAIIFT